MIEFTSLTKTEEFERVKNEGQRFLDNGLEVFIKESETPGVKLGIQVSSKIANAAKRNKVKRRIKEATRLLEEKKSIDMVVIVRKSGLETDLSTIQKTLKKHPSLFIEK